MMEEFTVPENILKLSEERSGEVNVIRADWDHQGVYFYQAYSQQIADFALKNGNFGGDGWNPDRMSWIKPSLGWMLYRAGYGSKDRNQERILRIKLSHSVLSEILTNSSLASCVQGSGPVCRVQWDPERDLMTSQLDKSGSKREPRKMPAVRAIQIGVCQDFSIQKVSKLEITDVTELARAVGAAHHGETEEDCRTLMATLQDRLPQERPYLPRLPVSKLIALKLWTDVN